MRSKGCTRLLMAVVTYFGFLIVEVPLRTAQLNGLAAAAEVAAVVGAVTVLTWPQSLRLIMGLTMALLRLPVLVAYGELLVCARLLFALRCYALCARVAAVAQGLAEAGRLRAPTEALQWRVSASVRAGQPAWAHRACRDWARSHPRELATLGFVQLELGLADQAQLSFQEAQRQARLEANALMGRAALAVRAEDLDRAIEYAMQAVQHGFSDARFVTRSPDMAPLRRHCRWPGILEAVKRNSRQEWKDAARTVAETRLLGLRARHAVTALAFALLLVLLPVLIRAVQVAFGR